MRHSWASVELLGIQVALASVEDLIIAKLEWSQLGDSELQRRDLLHLLDASWDSIDQRYIEVWVNRLGLERPWQEVLYRFQTRDD